MTDLDCPQCGDHATTRSGRAVSRVDVRGDNVRMCFDGDTVYLHEPVVSDDA